MRVGLLGGTFDPVHRGHLAIAGECRERLVLERVCFVPAGQPWLKAGPPLAEARRRLRMVELATAGQPHFQVLANEVERPGISYTVDTLEELQAAWGPAAELYFILGRDAFQSLPRWKDSERLLSLCRWVVVNRPGYEEAEGEGDCSSADLADHRPGTVIPVSLPSLDISSTEIRRRVANGQPIDHLVPEAVAYYIAEHGLYRDQR